jgi:hypothetical protein
MKLSHAVLLVVILGCSRATPTAAPDAAPKETPHAAASLPDRIATFDAGPLVSGDGFTRRTYSRAGAHVTVTLAHIDLGIDGYDRWVRQSEQGYPQATLDLPAGAGNGFYECTDPAMVRCNLLIQLRSGAHVEIRGDPASSRVDADAIAAGLPLGDL